MGGKPKRRPAETADAREAQLIALAVDVVEQRLIDGTATSQETTHFLKLGSSRERLEQQRLEAEAKLAEAKVEAYASGQRVEELMTEAITAFRDYSGNGGMVEDDDY